MPDFPAMEKYLYCICVAKIRKKGCIMSSSDEILCAYICIYSFFDVYLRY